MKRLSYLVRNQYSTFDKFRKGGMPKKMPTLWSAFSGKRLAHVRGLYLDFT
jgi:hypothetical protein